MALSEISPLDSTSASLLKRLHQPTNKIAWDQFVRLYAPLLFYWARKSGLAEADCADLVQDVFCVLIRKLPEFQYDPSKSFRSWLKTVLLNTWRNRCRARIDQPRSDLELDSPRSSPIDDFVDLEEAEYRQHLVVRAAKLIEADFEPATWQACWKFTVEGRPAADVARELNLTVNAVYLAKSRVLARLRSELDGLLD